MYRIELIHTLLTSPGVNSASLKTPLTNSIAIPIRIITIIAIIQLQLCDFANQHKMNPVVVLLLALNGAAQLVEAQPVAFHPFGALNRPARVTFDAAQPLRTRSLPQPSLSIDNHAGPINTKNVLFPDVQAFLGLVVEKARNGTKIKTTTEPSTQPATVDIKTLPGFWLRDPSRIPESTGASYEVDYRTERYRLDDLLVTNKRDDVGHIEEGTV